MAIQPVDASAPVLEPLQLQAILGYLGLLPPVSTATADGSSTVAAAPPPLALPSAPLHFLATHIDALPPNLAAYFGPVVTPQVRSGIPTIRNRRLQWALASPPALSAYSARDRHPLLYERIVGHEVAPPARPSGAADEAEDAWGQNRAVLGGRAQHGNLGALLQSFEDEREGERRRDRKREERLRENEVTEEFDSESEDEDEEVDQPQDDGGFVGPDEELSGEERLQVFERLVREKWIDGHEVRPSSREYPGHVLTRRALTSCSLYRTT